MQCQAATPAGAFSAEGWGGRQCQHWMSLKQPVSHMLCSGSVWELCFHTALGKSLLINLKWKPLIVSRICNSLALPHQQWQWAALNPNCRQQSVGRANQCLWQTAIMPPPLPKYCFWVRLSLCIPFSQMGLSLSSADHYYL